MIPLDQVLARLGPAARSGPLGMRVIKRRRKGRDPPCGARGGREKTIQGFKDFGLKAKAASYPTVPQPPSGAATSRIASNRTITRR